MTLLASILQLMTYFVWTGAQLVAAGTIVNILFPGVPIEVGMILVAVWVAGYTMLGGMLADTLLDFIQMFFTAGGVLLIFLLHHERGWRLGGDDVDHRHHCTTPSRSPCCPIGGRFRLPGLLRRHGLDLLDRRLDGDRLRLRADPGPVPALDVGPQRIDGGLGHVHGRRAVPVLRHHVAADRHHDVQARPGPREHRLSS